MKKLERQYIIRRLRGLMLLTLLGTAAHAQNITSAEYFLDTDPGVGNGTPVIVGASSDSVSCSGVINTFGLIPGDHFAYVRTRSNSGAWSLHTPQHFYIKKLLTDAEYFWDADPGAGNGTPIAVSNSFDSVNVTATVTTAGLATGYHTLYVRTRTEGNQWSLHAQQHIYIRESLAAAEYYWDTDPGVGNGTALPLSPALDSVAFGGIVATSGLQPGRHMLYVRTKTASGVWGLHQQQQVYITNSVAAAEYFWDTDPGVGNGTALSIGTPSDSVHTTASIHVPIMPPGIHYVYLRTKSVNGLWSLHAQDSVDVLPCAFATASMRGDTVFCNGNSGILHFSGTPNAMVVYKSSGHAANDTAMLNGSGIANVNTGMLNMTTSYKLLASYLPDFPGCQTALTDSVLIVTAPCGPCTKPPARPASIAVTNYDKVCPGQTRNYAVSASAAVGYYLWTIPAGSRIVSGQGTNSINVQYGNGFTASDSIRVVAANGCGFSQSRSRYVEIGTTPSKPSTISGQKIAICNLSNVPYSVMASSGITYNWSFDMPGGTITSGQGTASVTATFNGFGHGNIMVTASNGCGISAPRTLLLDPAPDKPAPITGPATACPGNQNVPYSIPAVANASSYLWVAPPNATISDGTTTSSGNSLVTGSNAITVNFGNRTGSITVRAINSCDTSASRLLSVTTACGMREGDNTVIAGSMDIELYPNPAHDEVNIRFSASADGAYGVRIVDAVGRSVLTGSGFATSGENRIKLELNGIAAGAYSALLMIDGVQHTRSFIVK